MFFDVFQIWSGTLKFKHHQGARFEWNLFLIHFFFIKFDIPTEFNYKIIVIYLRGHVNMFKNSNKLLLQFTKRNFIGEQLATENFQDFKWKMMSWRVVAGKFQIYSATSTSLALCSTNWLCLDISTSIIEFTRKFYQREEIERIKWALCIVFMELHQLINGVEILKKKNPHLVMIPSGAQFLRSSLRLTVLTAQTNWD